MGAILPPPRYSKDTTGISSKRNSNGPRKRKTPSNGNQKSSLVIKNIPKMPAYGVLDPISNEPPHPASTAHATPPPPRKNKWYTAIILCSSHAFVVTNHHKSFCPDLPSQSLQGWAKYFLQKPNHLIKKQKTCFMSRKTETRKK